MKIDIEFATNYGTYKDAIYLDDGATYSDEEIEQMKRDRLERWIYNIENPLQGLITPTLRRRTDG